jgi:hypothetical protein
MIEAACHELSRREAIRLLGCAAAVSGESSVQSGPAATIASVLDRQITNVERQVVELADAMPETKFNFSPEHLRIPGSEYQGVRTFGLQTRHVAASNYALWASLTEEVFPRDFLGGDGPERLRSKADILQFLRDSFALGHKAVATLRGENVLQAAKGFTMTRLEVATFAVSHAFDHYGQMVEYVRMNGIIPPVSR